MNAVLPSFLPGFPVMLAPMAGFTDITYRGLCGEMGCDFTFTEMISAKGLMYGGKSAALLEPAPDGRPWGVQLFGREPAIIAETVRRLCGEGGPALIDLNMGCPAHKITGGGAGCALMKDPSAAARIIEAAVRESSLPVSVKFRKGWDGNHVNCVEFARMAEDSGAAFITIHGRTGEQMYSGRADWDIIAGAKRAVSIPVIGNGDIFRPEDVPAMREYTGCDGVMIARGAIGNPFIFAGAKAAVAGRPCKAPSAEERLDMAILHTRRLVARKGPWAVVEMRKHIPAYAKGMKGAAAFRAEASKAPTAEALIAIIEEFKREQA